MGWPESSEGASVDLRHLAVGQTRVGLNVAVPDTHHLLLALAEVGSTGLSPDLKSQGRIQCLDYPLNRCKPHPLHPLPDQVPDGCLVVVGRQSFHSYVL